MADETQGGKLPENRDKSISQEYLRATGGGRLQVSDYNQRVFQLVVENVEYYAVFVIGLNGEIVSWNPGVEKLLGYRENEFIGKKGAIIFTPEDIAAGVVEREFDKALKEGRCEDTRWHVRRNGSQFWANGLMMILKDETGDVRGFVKIMRDNTAAKQAEEDLRQSLTQTNEILESISDAFYAVDSDFNFTYINKKAEELWERKRETLIGKCYWTEFPQSDNSESYKMHHTALEEQRVIHYETVSPILKRWIDVTIYPNPRGGLSVYFRDIAKRKKAEEEREKLLESARNAHAEAEAATKARDEFISVVSHELRAPLHSILGWNEILKQHPTPEMVKKVTEIIERQSKQQVQLIEDLLDSAQIAAGNLSLNLETVDLIKIIVSAIDNLRPVAANKDLQLNTALTSSSLPMTGDEQRLTQIISNLLTNAIKFTTAGGQITVEQHLEHSGVVIMVKDSGKGINPDFLPHVFERYAQEGGSSAKARGGGLGLGLSLVRHLVEMHDGSVTAESEGEGKGATFTVKFSTK